MTLDYSSPQKVLRDIRLKYGNTAYVTIFNDDLIVPWTPLSIEEYLAYVEDIQFSRQTFATLENEIFSNHVLDQAIVRQLPFLHAGIVSSVVDNIWNISGPSTGVQLKQDLNLARNIVYNGTHAIMHQLVETITLAFPYTPEQVYAMDYNTFLTRLVQAERKLISSGYIQDQLQINLPNEDEEEKEVPERKKVDAKELWEQINGIGGEKEFPATPQTGNKKRKKKGKWWKTSPVLEAKEKHHIDFRREGNSINAVLESNMDLMDLDISRAKMVEEAQKHYSKLIEELEKKRRK